MADFEGVYQLADTQLGVPQQTEDSNPSRVGNGLSKHHNGIHVGISRFTDIIHSLEVVVLPTHS